MKKILELLLVVEFVCILLCYSICRKKYVKIKNLIDIALVFDYNLKILLEATIMNLNDNIRPDEVSGNETLNEKYKWILKNFCQILRKRGVLMLELILSLLQSNLLIGINTHI